MAKMPSPADVGFRLPLDPSRPTGTYDASSIAKAGQAVAAGEQALGKGISELAAGIGEEQVDKQRYEIATAHADLVKKQLDLDTEFINDTDANTRVDRYTSRLTQATQESAAVISNPAMRQRFLDTVAAPLGARDVYRQSAIANQQGNQDAIAKFGEEKDWFINQGAGNPDPVARTKILDGINSRVDALIASHVLTPVQGLQQKRAAVKQFATADALAKAQRGDYSALDELYKSQTGANGPSSGPAQSINNAASNLGISPRDLAAAISYETGGTFDPNKVGGKGNNYLGLIQFGPEERAKYGVRQGMTFGDQMQAVESFLRDRGVKPGMGLSEIYRTINGGNPNASLNASDGNGTIAQHIARIQREHMGSADKFLQASDTADGPSEGASPRTNYDYLSAPEKALLIQQVLRVQSANDVAAQRALSLQDKLQKEQSNAAEDEWRKKLVDDKSTFSLGDVVNDNRMTQPAQDRVIEFAKRLNKPDPATATSHRMLATIFENMNRPDGDPNKITDERAIDKAFIDGDLVKADYDWAIKRFRESKSPDGEVLTKQKAAFIDSVKHNIDKSNPLMGKIDVSGPQQLYLLNYDIDRKVEEYRKAGKNPHDLFNPSKPDFLGKPEALAPYQKTLQQSLADRVKSLTVNPDAGSRIAPQSVQARKPGESPDDYLKRVK